MTIRLACPKCRTEYELDDATAGELVECECGARFEVPEASAAEAPAPTPAAAVAVTCPDCGETYEVSAADLDAALECACGTIFEAREPTRPTSDVEAVEVEVEVDVDVESTPVVEPVEEPVAEAVPEAEVVVETDRTATPRAADSKRSRKASNPAVLYGIVGGAALLAILLIVRLSMPGSKDDSPPKETVASSESEPNPTPASVPESPRNDEPPGEPVAANDPAGDPSEPSIEAELAALNGSVPEVGSSNPNDLTDPDEFIVGPMGSPNGEGATSNPPEPESEAKPQPTAPEPDEPEATPPEKKEPTPFVAFVFPENPPEGLEKTVERALEEQRTLEKLAGEKGKDSDPWRDQLAIVGGWLKEANTRLAPGTDPQTVVRVRLLLAQACLAAGYRLEAGLLGTSLAETTPDDLFAKADAKPEKRRKPDKPVPPKPPASNSVGAQIVASEIGRGSKQPKPEAEKADLDRPGQSAAMIALAALVAAHDEAPVDERDFERKAITRAASVLLRRWPDHEKADGIALYVGDLHRTSDEPETAIAWYTRVSNDSDLFAASRLLAGQASWSLAEKNDDPANADRAERLLSDGIEAAGDDADLANNVVIAKFTLARMHEKQGRFEKVVELLTDPPNAVVDAVSAEGPRPARGARSLAFAKLVYTSLVRARIQVGDLESARGELESVLEVGGEDLAVELVLEMAEGDGDGDRAVDADLRATAVAVLDRASQDVASLSTPLLLRSAELSTRLAVTPGIEDEQRTAGHRRAVAFYDELLQRGLKSSESTRAVRFRLANSLAAAGEAERSFGLLDELLAAEQNVFDGQFAAAEALREQGRRSRDVNQLVAAIAGPPDKPHVWGWAKLSTVYQRLHARDETRDDYRERFLECRLGVARTRRAIATLYEGEQRTAELEKALRELTALSLQSGTHDGPAWESLDAEFRAIAGDLGRDPRPLFE